MDKYTERKLFFGLFFSSIKNLKETEVFSQTFIIDKFFCLLYFFSFLFFQSLFYGFIKCMSQTSLAVSAWIYLMNGLSKTELGNKTQNK